MKMELKGLLKLVVVMGVVVGGCRGDVNSFRDCYAKCFIFCMIEPDKSLCTCTTQCLKECIFPSLPSATTMTVHPHTQNLAYCKLGCATSLCSNFSKPQNPDGKNVESCVGSCSNKCIMSYSSSPP
ncbi:hypothetical protein L2E82_02513 [Cichorium intybus]|uniref:Uncharacterized protein n=1 Tax=Cichorium intybus TaxID=13427 RepID=A0ACB9H3G9_CICIN|nr:hypothetical protein L2E82_02513 [Cichorium intybus]